jgi:two-component system, NarL family, sensor histidine kinase DegS
VTEPTAMPIGGIGPVFARATALARNLPRRIREREFWIIQAGVLGVTSLHIVAESWGTEAISALSPAFHHVPVVLYLAPIAYASLRYGIEGAVLTSMWCALLTVPNLVIWHAHDLEWLGESVFVVVVAAAGVTMAVLVERERHARRHAEATSRRLVLLNEIATSTLTTGLRHTLDQTLARLVSVLELEAACVAVVDPDEEGGPLSVLACRPGRKGAGGSLVARVEGWRPPASLERSGGAGDGVVALTLSAELPEPGSKGRVDGLLAAKVEPGRELTPGEIDLLKGVASQLALALANARLQERARDRLRSYAQLVTRAQEEERKRIARELHDQAAQNLVAIRRNLDALERSLADHPAAAELTQLSDLAGRTLDGLRTFSRDLRPPVLDDLGLVSALDGLVADVGERGDLAVGLVVTGTRRRLPIETELALFRIGQAALHNIERHAQAGKASVALTFEPRRVRLTINDDGRGFEAPGDLDDLTHAGKLGLIGMAERAQLVGGTLHIDSAPGTGTRIAVEVLTPIARHSAKRAVGSSGPAVS